MNKVIFLSILFYIFSFSLNEQATKEKKQKKVAMHNTLCNSTLA